MVRGKFRVEQVTEHARFSGREVKLEAVYDDGIEENRRFAEATPTGEITMHIDNPAAAEQFKVGTELYVDFTPVPAPQAEAGPGAQAQS